MKTSRRSKKIEDPDLSMAGRLVAALGSLFFSLPVAFLLWLSFNTQLASASLDPIPNVYLVNFVLAMAMLGFAFPRFITSVIGWLWETLLAIGRWW